MEIPAGRDPNEFLYDEALEFVAKGDFETANLYLCNYLMHVIGHSEAESLLGFCYFKQGNAQAAVRQAESAIRHDPSNAYGYHVLGMALHALGKQVEALDAVQSALNLEPAKPEFLVTLAYLHMDMGKVEEALAAASLASEREPSLASAYNAKALFLIDQKRLGEAAQVLTNALIQNPNDATSLSYMGWINLQGGNHEAALKCFARVYEVDPNTPSLGAGLIDALKGSGTIYASVLSAMLLFIKNIGRLKQLITVIGITLGRALSEIPRLYPKLAPLIASVLLVWRIFSYFIWTLEASFTMVLRLNRYGRMAVSPKQKLISNVVGSCWLLAFVFWGYHYYIDPFTVICRLAPAIFLSLPMLWIDTLSNTSTRAGKLGLFITSSVTASALIGLILSPFKLALALSLIKFYFYSFLVVLLILSFLNKAEDTSFF